MPEVGCGVQDFDVISQGRPGYDVHHINEVTAA